MTEVNSLIDPSPIHCPLDSVLAGYASGTLSAPLHVLVASHLSLKGENRNFVSTLENALSREMMEADPSLMSKPDRDRRLAQIFDADSTEMTSQETSLNGLFPSPLHDYLGHSFESLKWRRVMPGLREVKVENSPGCEASLLWIKAGRAMPSHSHAGLEATLVLQGSFHDTSGQFRRGDMAVVDSETDHKPIAGQEEDCICFAVSEGPVHLTGPLAGIFNWLKRH